jgi:hypothetical protein
MSREWFISEALSSVRRLEELLDQLSDEEITSLINLEEETARRKVFLDKLYREARQRARKQFIR